MLCEELLAEEARVELVLLQWTSTLRESAGKLVDN